MVNNRAQPRIWLIVLATIVTTAVAVCGSGLAAVVVGLGYCGGDGGQPYAAPASPRGKLCNGDAGSALLGVGLLGGPVVALAGGLLAATRRRWKPFLIGVGLAAALILAPLAILLAASPTCAHGRSGSVGCDSY